MATGQQVLGGGEHDRAWPAGPTCACNLGPLCRRHHRIKQTGWTKTRLDALVRWTSPTGRRCDSVSPWCAPQRSRRPAPTAVRLRRLSPAELEGVRWDGLDPDDPAGDELRISDDDNACLARGAAPT